MSSKCYKSAIMTLFLLPFGHGSDCNVNLICICSVSGTAKTILFFHYGGNDYEIFIYRKDITQTAGDSVHALYDHRQLISQM